MKNEQIKLALYGLMGSGKDFAADYLIEKYGFTRYAFADNVRLVSEAWFPEMYGDGTKKPRELLQSVGTKFREIDENVWIKALLDDIRRKNEQLIKEGFYPENIVITDCRMPNEYQKLKENGYVFVRICASDEIRNQRMIERGDIFDSNDTQHHTESFYDSFDYDHSIPNDESPENLYRRIDYLMSSLMSDNND